MRIRIGDHVSGVVVRSLGLSARTRVETFRVVFDGLPTAEWDLPDSDELVVGRFPFEGVAGDPLLLWDGSVTVESVQEIHAFFDGNVERYQPALLRVVEAMTVQPLVDDEFWPIIDSLGRRTWESTIRAAERILAEQGEQFAIRWSQTAALKALDLANALESVGLAAGDQLHAIGATLAQGKDVYLAVRRDPTTFDPRWLADLSSQTIWIGAGAIDRISGRGMRVQVETSFSARHREILKRTKAEVERWQREHNIPSEDEDPGPFFRVARTVVNLTANYRERLFLLVDAEDALAEPSHAMKVVESFGGKIVAGPEFSTEGGLGGLFNGEVFTVKRRSTVPAAEYLARHASIPD